MYADSFKRTHNIENVLVSFNKLKENKNKIFIAGRIMAKRIMGKVVFFDIQDGSGRMQCFCSKSELLEDVFINLKKYSKIGDIVGVGGSVFVTQKNEKTVKVEDFQILSVSIRDLPEKFHGLNDTETRYRKRYLDLIMNSEQEMFLRKDAKLLRQSEIF